MEAKIRNIGIHTLVSPKGDINYYNISEFEEILYPLLTRNTVSIVVDCSNVSHMDSSALKVILQTHDRLKMKDGGIGLGLVNINSDIRTVITYGEFNQIFKIYGSLDELI